MGFAEYPVEALEKGISGTVRIAITVSPSGTVTTASVVDGPEALRASALKAAWAQQYSPAQSTTAMTIAVTYTLTGNFWGVGIGDAAVSRIQIVRLNPEPRSQVERAASNGASQTLRRAASPRRWDYPAAAKDRRRIARLSGAGSGCWRSGCRNPRGNDRRARQRQRRAGAAIDSPARSGCPGCGEAVEVRTNADERRPCADRDDGDGEFHTEGQRSQYPSFG